MISPRDVFACVLMFLTMMGVISGLVLISDWERNPNNSIFVLRQKHHNAEISIN